MFRYCLLLVLCLPSIVQGQVFTTETGHAEFESSVPLHSFTGTSDFLVGKIDLSDSTIDFYLDVNTLETGIRKRDNDMLETLEAEQYPFAEFFGKLISDFNRDSSKPQQVTVEGEFTVHGVSNPLKIEGTLHKTEDELQVQASWTINMEDYDIEPPGILFYRVSEKIPVSINATLSEK